MNHLFLSSIEDIIETYIRFIPGYKDDVENPKDRVRGIIPERQKHALK